MSFKFLALVTKAKKVPVEGQTNCFSTTHSMRKYDSCGVFALIKQLFETAIQY